MVGLVKDIIQMKSGKKIAKKLDRRIRDFEATMAYGGSEAKVQQRKATGGYTRPGSRKKG
jgi:hypothetical protein